jgi:hypothetical protein
MKNYKATHREIVCANFAVMAPTYNEHRREKYHANHEGSIGKLHIWYRGNAAGRLCWSAKRRAKERNIPFDITPEDIIVPEYCPALGIPLVVGNGCAHDGSPSLDRITPSLGYVRGNIVVVSHKANTIKSNATVEDMQKVVDFYKSLKAGD